MIIALLAAMAVIQQPPPPGVPPPPPPPPPPPIASSSHVRAAVHAAQICFEKNWAVARERRIAAELLVRPLISPVGSAEWLSARSAVLAFVAARRDLKECVIQLVRASVDGTEADHAARDYWSGSMNFNIDGQAVYETALLVGLVDRSFSNPILGQLTGH